MIHEDELRAILKEILQNKDPDDWGLDFDFMEEALDSLDRADLGLRLEERIGRKISDEDLEALTTMRAVLDYVEASKP